MEYSSSNVMYMDDKVVYNSRFNSNHNGGHGISRRLVLDQPNHPF